MGLLHAKKVLNINYRIPKKGLEFPPALTPRLYIDKPWMFQKICPALWVLIQMLATHETPSTFLAYSCWRHCQLTHTHTYVQTHKHSICIPPSCWGKPSSQEENPEAWVPGTGDNHPSDTAAASCQSGWIFASQHWPGHRSCGRSVSESREKTERERVMCEKNRKSVKSWSLKLCNVPCMEHIVTVRTEF